MSRSSGRDVGSDPGPGRPVVLDAADGYGGLAAATELADRLAAQASLPNEQSYALRLAVDELVTNVVMHGYRNRPGRIVVDGAAERDRVWVSITDWAPAFDPSVTPRAFPTPETLDESEPGGVGLALVHEGAHHIEYERVDGANRVVVAMTRGGRVPS